MDTQEFRRSCTRACTKLFSLRMVREKMIFLLYVIFIVIICINLFIYINSCSMLITTEGIKSTKLWYKIIFCVNKNI